MQPVDDRQRDFINAAFEGNLPVVQAFLDVGVDINQALLVGWNALHAAIENMQIEVVKYLLAAGADPNTAL